MLGRVRVNPSITQLEGDAEEEFSARALRTRDALSGGGFVVGAVRLAHQVAASLGKKLVIHPVHSHRYMAASVHISVKTPVKIHHKTFFVDPLDRQEELA